MRMSKIFAEKPLSQAVIQHIPRKTLFPASTTDNCTAWGNARQSCLRRLEKLQLTDSDGNTPYCQPGNYLY